tara:strand:+ start:291 stop:779 length:489 start_codon:yes stop_codon:yes gene_type:complete
MDYYMNKIMNKSVRLGTIGASVLFGFIFIGAFAEDSAGVKPPKSWNIAGLSTMELNDLPDIDWIPVESGTKRNSETLLFEGENIVSVWDAGPARLTMDTPLSFDEFVVVLKGELVLTDQDGNSVTYKPGDMFMLPKGFVGTWDMTEEYRELIVVDTTAYYGG